jgi:glycosyltransferase involved in cell wall biosynthesis
LISNGTPQWNEYLTAGGLVTLLRKPNGGQSSARNFAVAHSRSALIALLDQDDRWYPNHLQVLRREFAEHEGMPLGWAYSDFDDIDAAGRVVSRDSIARRNLENPKRHLASLLAHGLIIQPSATLIGREAFQAVGGFDERLCGYEDDDLFLRIFRASFDNSFVPYPTSQWRIHEACCGASQRMDDSLRYYIKKLLTAYPNDCWRGAYYARDAIAPRFIATWLQMYDVCPGLEIPELRQDAGIRRRSPGARPATWYTPWPAHLFNHFSAAAFSVAGHGDGRRWETSLSKTEIARSGL